MDDDDEGLLPPPLEMEALRELVICDGTPLVYDPATIWTLRSQHRFLPRPIGVSSVRSGWPDRVSGSREKPPSSDCAWSSEGIDWWVGAGRFETSHSSGLEVGVEG